MATVTKPMALDESFNTTENTSRNVADVLAEGLDNIAESISPRSATEIPIESGSATNTKDYIDNKTANVARFYVATVDNLTVTANSALNLGTVSELTGGTIATRYQCKGISVISGAGANYSFLGAVVIGATDNVAIYPFRSDTNLSIRIGFLY